MPERSFTFTPASFDDYPRTVPKTVDYLKENGSVDEPNLPDVYVKQSLTPSAQDLGKLWVQPTTPVATGTSVSVPVSPASFSVKIITGNLSGTDLVAFDSNGDPDPGFSTSSWINGNVNSRRVTAIAADPSGNIYVAGNELVSGEGTRVYKINLNGTRDLSFQTSLFDYGGGSNTSSIHRIDFDSSGKLYVCGNFQYYNYTPGNFASLAWGLLRLNTNGTRDTSFLFAQGPGEYTNYGSPKDFIILPNGNLFVVGSGPPPTYIYQGFYAVISSSSGALVSSVGGHPYAGFGLTQVRYGYDGGIYVASGTSSSSFGAPSITRFTYSSGVVTLDSFFGLLTTTTAITSGTFLPMPDSSILMLQWLSTFQLPEYKRYRYFEGKSYPSGLSVSTTNAGPISAPLTKTIPTSAIPSSLERYFSQIPLIDELQGSPFSWETTGVDWAFARLNLDGSLDKKLILSPSSQVPPSAFNFLFLGPDSKIYIRKTLGLELAYKNSLVFVGTPGIQAPDGSDAYLSQPYSLQLTSFPNAVSYAATGLPPGLSINSGTGLISGTPTTLGTYTVSLSATNIQGTGTKNLTIIVTDGYPTNNSSLRSIRKFYSNAWKEFSTITRGTILLVPASFEVKFPWGESGKTYNMSLWGEPNFTVPALPFPPVGFKYKYYIGANISEQTPPAIY